MKENDEHRFHGVLVFLFLSLVSLLGGLVFSSVSFVPFKLMTDELFQAYDGPFDDRKPTGRLFDIPESKPDRLYLARKRMQEAQTAYDGSIEIDEDCDGFGIIPDEIKNEYAAARYELLCAESQALKKMTVIYKK